MKTRRSILITAILVVSFCFETLNAQEQFRFSPQAFQFRFNQSFFKTSGELFEDILKASGIADKNNVITIASDSDPSAHRLQYRKIKTNIRLENNRMISLLNIDIADSNFSLTSVSSSCQLLLSGPLSFEAILSVTDKGSVEVEVPEATFKAENLQIKSTGCGFAGWILPNLVRSKLQSSLEELIGKVANEQELKAVEPTNIDDLLRKARVAVNTLSKGPLDDRRSRLSDFNVDVGIRGYLSNAREGFERISIRNPRKNYLNQIGLQWTLDAGFEARSQNIFDLKYEAPTRNTAPKAFPAWGLGPYKKTGNSPLDFDAGLMIRTSFLKTMFEKLYEAGFFNLQIQDSQINKNFLPIRISSWCEDLKLVLPNGRQISPDNYADSRLALRLLKAPVLNSTSDQSLELSVPELEFAYFASTKGDPREYEIVRVRARFNLKAMIGLDEDAHLSIKFGENPLNDFQILARAGIDPSVPDHEIRDVLNKSINGLLDSSGTEIPFLKGRKIDIRSLGVEGAGTMTEALSIYLKIK
ncbi:MAG: hypothetical protein ACK5P7_10035 [Bdellovibrio sp.]